MQQFLTLGGRDMKNDNKELKAALPVFDQAHFFHFYLVLIVYY